ncbi:MAG: TetR/AcrR family transcriptional regulator [Bacteroidales bacterium]|nr:TetR/AcrR family transcriptional regulator [Bacteroidales bacterium]
MEVKLEQILSRVYDLYNMYGVKSVTMDDVARELGISKKTLYQHVKDKAELVELVMSRNSMMHRSKIKEITKHNSNAIIELLEVNQYMSIMLKDHNPTLDYDLKKYYPEIYIRLKHEIRKHMHNSIKNNLLRGQQEGLYRKEMDTDIISKLHITRMDIKYTTETFTLEELTSERVIREIFIYHLYGISNENGVKILNDKLKEYINADSNN